MSDDAQRQAMRQIFSDIYHKIQHNTPLTDAMEQRIAGVIEAHPEYHSYLKPAQGMEQDFFPGEGQTNPFLHMGMHISILEQLALNQPAGILELYQQLIARYNTPHDAEHVMMDCIAEMLWQSQRRNTAPDMQAYFKCLQQKLNN